MSRHRLADVCARSEVVVKGGNLFNPGTFWRMPADAENWDAVLNYAQTQGWKSRERDGDPSRVGSVDGPAA